MSTHINAANKNDIAESILLPGDPLRAKFIAENFLDSPKCYNEIRGMLGYTGTYRDTSVGSGVCWDTPEPTEVSLFQYRELGWECPPWGSTPGS